MVRYFFFSVFFCERFLNVSPGFPAFAERSKEFSLLVVAGVCETQKYEVNGEQAFSAWENRKVNEENRQRENVLLIQQNGCCLASFEEILPSVSEEKTSWFIL